MRRPPDAESRCPTSGTDSLSNTTPVESLSAVSVPPHRPWARRPDAREVERRFRIDRAGWRRRIDAARRISHDGADPAAPYRGVWTSEWAS